MLRTNQSKKNGDITELAHFEKQLKELVKEKNEYIDNECGGCYIEYITKQEQLAEHIAQHRIEEDFKASLGLSNEWLDDAKSDLLRKKK